MIKVDAKVTVWERFELDDEMKEPLEAFLKENPLADFLDIYHWAFDQGQQPDPEYVDGTTEYMDAEDNGGQSTLEIHLGNSIIFEK